MAGAIIAIEVELQAVATKLVRGGVGADAGDLTRYAVASHDSDPFVPCAHKLVNRAARGGGVVGTDAREVRKT